MDLQARTHLPIAQLDPSVHANDRTIKGIVTLIWPYSSSNQSISILLVEPDFRLRRTKGQVRICFRGSSAKAVTKSRISSGDGVLLSLVGVEWARNATTTKTPGRGVDWELRFGERVVLQVRVTFSRSKVEQLANAIPRWRRSLITLILSSSCKVEL